jgi:hypothetical protein
LLPAKEANHLVLEDEGDTYPGIEAAEVVGHYGQTEAWSIHVLPGSSVLHVFGRVLR